MILILHTHDVGVFVVIVVHESELSFRAYSVIVPPCGTAVYELSQSYAISNCNSDLYWYGLPRSVTLLMISPAEA